MIIDEQLAKRRVAPRIFIATSVLLFEHLTLFVSLTVQYEEDVIERLPTLWQAAILCVTLVSGSLIVALCALWLYWGERIRSEIEVANARLGRWHGEWLLLHFLLALLFFCASFAIFGLPWFAAWGGPALMVLWIASAVAMVFSILFAALGGALGSLAAQLRPVLFGALLVGFGFALVVPLVQPFWLEISLPVLFLTFGILSVCCEGAWVDPDISAVGFDNFAVVVNPSCSGIAGMALVALFLAGYLWRFREEHRFPQALLLVPLGVGLSFLANGLRISGLILVGQNLGPEIANGAFHSLAGWVFFCLVTLGIVAISRHITWFRARDISSAQASDSATPDFLLPVLIWLGVAMLTGAFSVGQDALYPLRVVATVLALFWLGGGVFTSMARCKTWLAYAPQQIIAPLLIGISVFLLWLALHPPAAPARSLRDVAQAEGWSIGYMWMWLGFRLVGSILIVPVIEELAFRGYLQRRLISADFTKARYDWHWPAALISAAAFALLHSNWIAGLLAGLAFSFAASRRGKLSDAVLAHATANLLVAVAVLGAGRWDLW